MSTMTHPEGDDLVIGVIPNPPVLGGSMIDTEGIWKLKIDEYRSPLTASTAPVDAKHRAKCLLSLAIGLSISDDKLVKVYENDVAFLPPLDTTNMDPYVRHLDYDRKDRMRYLLELRKKYIAAQTELTRRQLNSDEDRFLNNCLLVNIVAARLMLNRMLAITHGARLRAVGRNPQAVHVEIELKLWNRQFTRKLAKFCLRHPWLKLDLENAFNAVRLHRSSYEEICLMLPDSNDKTARQVWLQALDPLPAEATSSSTVAERVFSTVQSIIGGQSESGRETPATTDPAEPDLGLLSTGVECPICTSDLYVSPSDDLLDEQPLANPVSAQDESTAGPSSASGGTANAVAESSGSSQEPQTGFGGVIGQFSNLGVLANSTTTEDIPDLPRNYAPQCTTGCDRQHNVDLWKAQDSEDNSVPKVVFCPQCNNGFHAECIWKWIEETGLLAGSNCPFCRAPMSPAYIQNVVRPKVLAEQRRVRLERRRLAKLRAL